jgi:hypothetical protein
LNIESDCGRASEVGNDSRFERPTRSAAKPRLNAVHPLYGSVYFRLILWSVCLRTFGQYFM